MKDKQVTTEVGQLLRDTFSTDRVSSVVEQRIVKNIMTPQKRPIKPKWQLGFSLAGATAVSCLCLFLLWDSNSESSVLSCWIWTIMTGSE